MFTHDKPLLEGDHRVVLLPLLHLGLVPHRLLLAEALLTLSFVAVGENLLDVVPGALDVGWDAARARRDHSLRSALRCASDASRASSMTFSAVVGSAASRAIAMSFSVGMKPATVVASLPLR